MNLVPAGNGFLCPEDPGEPGLKVKRWSVNTIEARIVSELCRGLNVLEIGTGLGVSTREIAKRAQFVHTVDIDPWVKENVSLPENSKFYTDIRDVPIGLDAAFIDGLHSYKQCTRDIKDARRIVKPDGLFIFHDARMEAIAGAIRNSRLEAIPIITRAGMALAWNK